jgi:hypothetical protein
LSENSTNKARQFYPINVKVTDNMPQFHGASFFHPNKNIQLNAKHIDRNLVESTFEPFSKYFADQKPKIIAEKYYVAAKEFKSKSWLQQLYLSMKMASNDVKRRLQDVA